MKKKEVHRSKAWAYLKWVNFQELHSKLKCLLNVISARAIFDEFIIILSDDYPEFMATLK